MDEQELMARLQALEDERDSNREASAKKGFIDKYGSKFGNDEGIGTAILAQLNRRGIDTSAADEAVQEIVDQLRQEASALLDKLSQVEEAVQAATGAPPPEAPPMEEGMPPPDAGAEAPPDAGAEAPPDAGAEAPPPEGPPPDAGVEAPMPEEGPPPGDVPSDARLKEVADKDVDPEEDMSPEDYEQYEKYLSDISFLLAKYEGKEEEKEEDNKPKEEGDDKSKVMEALKGTSLLSDEDFKVINGAVRVKRYG